MWSWFKNLVGKKEITNDMLVRRLTNPDSDLFFPDKAIEQQFKSLVQIAVERKDMSLLDHQARIYIDYVRSGNFEEFSEKFKIMKSGVTEYLIKQIDVILEKYDKLEKFWEICVTKYPQIVDHHYYNFVEMGKIRANIYICKEDLVMYRETVLETMESPNFKAIKNMVSIIDESNLLNVAFEKHAYWWVELLSNFTEQTEILELFNSIFLLM